MTTLSAHPARRSFRPYPLDGAMLWFHPDTGTHVRADAAGVHDRRRTAPRVVMFGITNACNLACTYCSRDTALPSRWDLESAATFLAGMAAAGTLEVAFGGGEPFAFRDFPALLERLFATTALALNVTTNGTLLTAGLLARLAPVLGQIRLSLHDCADWRSPARLLAEAPVRWGANVLLDSRTVAQLPELLEELAALGATDASLLSYVGPELSRHLSTADLRRCEAAVRNSSLPCRVSVCLGDRLGVDRLFAGVDGSGDCGAGHDFVTITPDRRLQSCSFQDAGLPIESADDVLRLWRERREFLQRASPRLGCSRHQEVRTAVAAPVATELRVWQAFSGNNSSECQMVARFRDAESAEQMLKELLPGYSGRPDERYSAPWLELFAKEGVLGPESNDSESPHVLTTFGRLLVAHTDWTHGQFLAVAGLAWKRGAQAWHGYGVHRRLAFAIEASDAAMAQSLAGTPTPTGTDAKENAAPSLTMLAHGRFVLGSIWDPFHDPEHVAASRRVLTELAGSFPIATDVAPWSADADALRQMAARLPEELPRTPRLLLHFWGEKGEGRAQRFASSITSHPFVHLGNLILIDKVERPRRLALRAHRLGGMANPLEGHAVSVTCSFPVRRDAKGRPVPKGPLEPEQWDATLRPRLRASLLGDDFDLQCTKGRWNDESCVTLRTGAPLPALATIAQVAGELGFQPWFSVTDTDALGFAFRRLLAELREQRRD